LDEGAGRGGRGGEIPRLDAPIAAGPAWGGGSGPLAGRKRRKNRVEPLDDGGIAADHQAVAALAAPHPARGADVDVVDAAAAQGASPAEVVLPVAVAAIDQAIAGR